MAPPPSISHTSSVGDGAGESKFRCGVERPDILDRRFRTAELVDDEVDGRELKGLDGGIVGEIGSDSVMDVEASSEGVKKSDDEAVSEISTLGRGVDSNESIKTVPVHQ